MYVIADLIKRREARHAAKLNRKPKPKTAGIDRTARASSSKARSKARAHRCTMCWGATKINVITGAGRVTVACGCQ